MWPAGVAMTLAKRVPMSSSLAAPVTANGAAPPAELKDVLEQLRGTLNYKNYELAATVVQRLTETPRALNGNGTAELPNTNPGTPASLMPYEYYINAVSLVQDSAGSFSVQIGEFVFATVTGNEHTRLQTALNLRDGEKVVVGTSTMRNRALVVVLTAKLLK